MVGILANILAGGVAGGAKAYGEVADNRIEDKREAAKAAALEKRMKNMAQFSHNLSMEQQKASQKYQDSVREEEMSNKQAKENIADADAKNIALLMRGEEGEAGGDEYSVPMGKEDMEQSLTGKGLLALEKAKIEDEKFEMEKEKHEMSKTTSDLPKSIEEYAFAVKTGYRKSYAEWMKKEGEKVPTEDRKWIKEQTDADLAEKWDYDPISKMAFVSKEKEKEALNYFRSAGYPKAVSDKDKDGNVIIKPGGFDIDSIGVKKEDTDEDFSTKNKLPPGTYTGDTPPVKGAIQAPNGGWYVKEQDGTLTLHLDGPEEKVKTDFDLGVSHKQNTNNSPQQSDSNKIDWDKRLEPGKDIINSAKGVLSPYGDKLTDWVRRRQGLN